MRSGTLTRSSRLSVGAALTLAMLLGTVGESRADGPFDRVDVGFLSLGGRAAYYDPKEGDGNWFGGAQARLHLGRFFAVEGSVDYRQTDIGETRVRTYPVQVSGLIYPFGLRRISPFLLGGGGWYYTNVEGPGDIDDTQNRFGLHAGGGLQVFLNRRFSVDGTYRYIWLEKAESKNVSLDDKKFDDSGHMFTIGLNFHF